MERSSQQRSLPDQHGLPAKASEDAHVLLDGDDNRRPDQHRFKRRSCLRADLQLGLHLELLDGTRKLAPVGVSPYSRVKQSQAPLNGVLNRFGEQNGARASAEYGMRICERSNGLGQT